MFLSQFQNEKKKNKQEKEILKWFSWASSWDTIASTCTAEAGWSIIVVNGCLIESATRVKYNSFDEILKFES